MYRILRYSEDAYEAATNAIGYDSPHLQWSAIRHRHGIYKSIFILIQHYKYCSPITFYWLLSKQQKYSASTSKYT